MAALYTDEVVSNAVADHADFMPGLTGLDILCLVPARIEAGQRLYLFWEGLLNFMLRFFLSIGVLNVSTIGKLGVCDVAIVSRGANVDFFLSLILKTLARNTLLLSVNTIKQFIIKL